MRERAHDPTVSGAASPRVRFVLVALLGGCLWGAAAPLAAQEARPPEALQKSEVIRLLSGGTYTQAEVAGIVRRSCLSFDPTERDLESFRALGAGPEVMQAIRQCAESPPPRPADETPPPTGEAASPPPGPRAVPAATLFLFPRRAEVLVDESLQVMAELTVGAVPLRNVQLILRDGTPEEGGAVLAMAVTGIQGQATFQIPPAGEPGVRRYTVAAEGREVRGVSTVEVRATASTEEPPAAEEPSEVERPEEAEEPVPGGTAVAEIPDGILSGDREAILAEARELSRQGSFQRARALFEHLLVEGRQDADLLLAYGRHLTRVGHHEEAKQVLRRAVGLDSSRVEALKALAFVYLWDEPLLAVRHYRRAVELAPADVEAWRGLARALHQAGQDGEARRAARRARELEP